MRKKEIITKKRLYHLYWNEELSVPEISKLLEKTKGIKIHTQKIYRLMWKWNLPRRDDSERTKVAWRDKGKRENMLIALHEILERGRKKAIALVERRSKFNLDEIKKLYLEEFMTFQEIENSLEKKVSAQSIRNWLKDEKVLKKRGEIRLLKWFKVNNISFDTFYHNSLKINKIQLCEKYNCSYTRIVNLIRMSKEYKDIEKMIAFKRMRKSNSEIGKIMKLSERIIIKYLKANMCDYHNFHALKSGRAPRFNLQKAIDLKKKRLSNKVIAEIMGYTVQTIRKNLKRNMGDYDKYKLEDHEEKERFLEYILESFSEKEIEDIFAMRFQCISINDIAFEYDTSVFVITTLLREIMPEYMKYSPKERYFRYEDW